MASGVSERHEQSAVLDGTKVFGGSFGCVSEIEVRGFSYVLCDVMCGMSRGFDERAINVVAVSGHAFPGGSELGPVDEVGCGYDV